MIRLLKTDASICVTGKCKWPARAGDSYGAVVYGERFPVHRNLIPIFLHFPSIATPFPFSFTQFYSSLLQFNSIYLILLGAGAAIGP